MTDSLENQSGDYNLTQLQIQQIRKNESEAKKSAASADQNALNEVLHEAEKLLAGILAMTEASDSKISWLAAFQASMAGAGGLFALAAAGRGEWLQATAGAAFTLTAAAVFIVSIRALAPHQTFLTGNDPVNYAEEMQNSSPLRTIQEWQVGSLQRRIDLMRILSEKKAKALQNSMRLTFVPVLIAAITATVTLLFT